MSKKHEEHECFLIMTASQVAKDAIELFLQYRDGYGKDEDEAMSAAVSEIAEADTRLRGVAPEMLSLVKRMRNFIVDNGVEHLCSTNELTDLERAIAKAEGNVK